MLDRCRNCGKPSGGGVVNQDWEAICPDCGQLVWLCPGDVAECRVARITPFGFFVVLGDGMEGLLPIIAVAPVDLSKQ
jgi:hypothetical protein